MSVISSFFNAFAFYSYSEKGVLTTFKGTMSDVIYKDIEPWLSAKLHENDDIDHSVMPGM